MNQVTARAPLPLPNLEPGTLFTDCAPSLPARAKLLELLARSRVVIFDLNGLIVDDEGVQFRAARDALAEQGIELSEQTWIESCVGTRAADYLKRILNADSGDPSIGALVNRKNELYRMYLPESLPSISRTGVLDLLNRLAEDGTRRLVLVTSALPDEVIAVLGKDGLGIVDRFSLCLTGADVARPKPDPEIFLKALSRAGTRSQDALAFEDSAVGVNAAASAGIPVVSIPNKYTKGQDFSRATLVLWP